MIKLTATILCLYSTSTLAECLEYEATYKENNVSVTLELGPGGQIIGPAKIYGGKNRVVLEIQAGQVLVKKPFCKEHK